MFLRIEGKYSKFTGYLTDVDDLYIISSLVVSNAARKIEDWLGVGDLKVEDCEKGDERGKCGFENGHWMVRMDGR